MKKSRARERDCEKKT